MEKFDDLVDNDRINNTSDNNAEVVRRETYTDDEIRDVNNISVTIPDTKTPIVIFFGSPASGKTLALLRMIRFLEQHNHDVIPEAVFRPQTDKHYTKMCVGLKDMAYSDYAPGGTDIISFMLVKVIDRMNNKTVCQILEAPGEHYFDGRADLSFPRYINAIRVSNALHMTIDDVITKKFGYSLLNRTGAVERVKEICMHKRFAVCSV